jgi:hypothetical protein
LNTPPAPAASSSPSSPISSLMVVTSSPFLPDALFLRPFPRDPAAAVQSNNISLSLSSSPSPALLQPSSGSEDVAWGDDAEESAASLVISLASLLDKDTDSTTVQKIVSAKSIDSFEGSRCLPMCTCKSNQDLGSIILSRMSVVMSSLLTARERESQAAPGSNKSTAYYEVNNEKAAYCSTMMDDDAVRSSAAV